MFSKGRSDVALKASILGIILITICVLIGSHWGINGVATGVAVYALVAVLFIQHMANRLIDLKMKSFLRAFRPAVVSSFVMLATLLGYRYMIGLTQTVSDVTFVLCAVPLGSAVYIGTLKMSGSQAWKEVMDLLKRLLRPVAKAKAITILR